MFFCGFNGLFGYMVFDGVQYFDMLEFVSEKCKMDLFDFCYYLYCFIIVINYYKDELYLLENCFFGEES